MTPARETNPASMSSGLAGPLLRLPLTIVRKGSNKQDTSTRRQSSPGNARLLSFITLRSIQIAVAAAALGDTGTKFP